jgi:Cys-tRNA(Pro)/Cys-tRNA(Cys) deacylase
MDENEEKLKKIIKDQGIKADHLTFNQSTHSVLDASKAVEAEPDDFVKSICIVDNQRNLIVAIVKGEDRVSTIRVGKALGIDRPRIATPDEVQELTGYPCGGTPGFGFDAMFLMDPRVFEKTTVYLGGGSESSLVKMSPYELKRVSGAKVVRVRK